VVALGKLHVLTDVELQSTFTHVDLARLALAGGANTIQFRQKTGSTEELIRTAAEIRRLCAKAGAAFIVNDRVDVAWAVEADGVHLGRDDFPIPHARRLLGTDRLIGGSASNLEEARQCVAEGADYVGFGPVYATSSKSDAGPAAGVELLREISAAVPVPVVAIGGIGLANLGDVCRAGAFGVAVISAVCCQPNPKAATRALRDALRDGGDPSRA
jgi:thiamine-phosphate pyrophosphorylase